MLQSLFRHLSLRVGEKEKILQSPTIRYAIIVIYTRRQNLSARTCTDFVHYAQKSKAIQFALANESLTYWPFSRWHILMPALFKQTLRTPEQKFGLPLHLATV